VGWPQPAKKVAVGVGCGCTPQAMVGTIQQAVIAGAIVGHGGQLTAGGAVGGGQPIVQLAGFCVVGHWIEQLAGFWLVGHWIEQLAGFWLVTHGVAQVGVVCVGGQFGGHGVIGWLKLSSTLCGPCTRGQIPGTVWCGWHAPTGQVGG
jgi:hypothetical protein